MNFQLVWILFERATVSTEKSKYGNSKTKEPKTLSDWRNFSHGRVAKLSGSKEASNEHSYEHYGGLHLCKFATIGFQIM